MNNLIEDRIKVGNIEGAKSLIVKELLQEDKTKFYADMEAEYNELFPELRLLTQVEWEDMAKVEPSTDLKWEDLSDADKEELVVLIDYSEDENHLTYDEYKNETEVVQEFKEPVFDAEGICVELGCDELTKPKRPYITKTITDEDIQVALVSIKEYTTYTKAVKVKELDELIIEHNTVAYDANGKAIGNMAGVVALAGFKFNKAIAEGTSPAVAYQAIYKDTTIGWKTVDNSISMVQVESVCEALEKSMIKLSEIIGAS